MHARPIAASMSALLLLPLAGCATMAGGAADIPTDAVETTRTEANGDTISEYRVAGQLRAIKVVPARGPTYYLYDRDGDGSVDDSGDEPPQVYYPLFKW